MVLVHSPLLSFVYICPVSCFGLIPHRKEQDHGQTCDIHSDAHAGRARRTDRHFQQRRPSFAEGSFREGAPAAGRGRVRQGSMEGRRRRHRHRLFRPDPRTPQTAVRGGRPRRGAGTQGTRNTTPWHQIRRALRSRTDPHCLFCTARRPAPVDGPASPGCACRAANHRHRFQDDGRPHSKKTRSNLT